MTPAGPVASGAPWPVVATLTDAGGRAIADRTVLLAFSSGSTTVNRAASADYAGRAVVNSLALAPGRSNDIMQPRHSWVAGLMPGRTIS